jgi:oxygen-independent coproporphyrinogen III oxidase
MAGIYIHVPFCRQACSYCDFYFVTKMDLIPHYVDALIREIGTWSKSQWTEEEFSTLYFGGGTPSTLSAKQLERILNELQKTFNVSQLEEFTFELNPDDADPDYLQDIRSLGVDRLSMGIQSFQPKLLEFMHRSHTAEEAIRSLEHIQQAGFKRFSADLIYGNPGQTMQMLDADIDQLLAFDIPHISAYALTIEESTRLGKMRELGRLAEAEDEDVAQQALHIQSRLEAAGLNRYEVSNYARPGAEAVHNTNYWEHLSYMGLGPGAHSLYHEMGMAWRWHNAKDLKAWMDDPEAVRSMPEELEPLQRAEEYILMRLRNASGLDIDMLSEEYEYDLTSQQREYWSMLQVMGLAQRGESLRLTAEGFNVVDRITVELISRGDEL